MNKLRGLTSLSRTSWSQERFRLLTLRTESTSTCVTNATSFTASEITDTSWQVLLPKRLRLLRKLEIPPDERILSVPEMPLRLSILSEIKGYVVSTTAASAGKLCVVAVAFCDGSSGSGILPWSPWLDVNIISATAVGEGVFAGALDNDKGST